MKYAFVFLSIVVMWLAMLMIFLRQDINHLLIYVVVLAMSVVLYLIGFWSKRR